MTLTKQKSILYNPWLIGTVTPILGYIGISLLDCIAGTKVLNSIWSAIMSVSIAIWNFFLMKFEVSLWFLIVLPIAVIGIFVIILCLIIFIQNNKNQEPSFLDYKEDVFGEVLYRWQYSKYYSVEYQISNISHHCPQCKCSIIYDKCPICKTPFFDKIKTDLEIKALISHKIETQMQYKEK